MKQVKEITKILNKYNIKYWIDHGTLLGFIREGNIIPWDKDIDICIKPSEIKKMNCVLQEFYKEYKIKKKKFDNELLSFVFIPKKKNKLIVGFEIYRKQKNYYVLPGFTQKLIFRKREPSKKLKWWIKNILYTLNPFNSFHVFLCLWSHSKWCPKQINFNKFPWNISFKKTHIWKIPSKFLEEFEFKDNIRIPKNPEKYLEFHYGKNWKIPKQDWNYALEDSGFKKIEKNNESL